MKIQCNECGEVFQEDLLYNKAFIPDVSLCPFCGSQDISSAQQAAPVSIRFKAEALTPEQEKQIGDYGAFVNDVGTTVLLQAATAPSNNENRRYKYKRIDQSTTPPFISEEMLCLVVANAVRSIDFSKFINHYILIGDWPKGYPKLQPKAQKEFFIPNITMRVEGLKTDEYQIFGLIDFGVDGDSHQYTIELAKNGKHIPYWQMPLSTRQSFCLPKQPIPPTTEIQKADGSLIVTPSSFLHHSLSKALSRPMTETGRDGFPEKILEGDKSIGEMAKIEILPATAKTGLIYPFVNEAEKEAFANQAREIAKNFDPITADFHDYISYLTATNPNRELPIKFTIQDFAVFRGANPSRGLNRKEKLKLCQKIEPYLNTYLTIKQDKPDKKGKYRSGDGRGALFSLEFSLGQFDINGWVDPEMATYIGRLNTALAYDFFGNRQTALMSKLIPKLDPYRQAVEKSLGRYLAWIWRIRQGKGDYAKPFKVSTLLKESEIPEDRRLKDIRARLEKALDCLASNKIIEAWQYTDGFNEAQASKTGGKKYYFDAQITIDPPESILDHYQGIELKGTQSKQLKAPSQKKPIGEQIKEHRLSLGLNQPMYAEKINVHKDLISRWERGVSKPSKAHMAKLKKILPTQKKNQGEK